jgi:hypothetical protein
MRLEDQAHPAPRDEPLQLVAGIDCLPDERFGHFFNIIIPGSSGALPPRTGSENRQRVGLVNPA